MGQKPGVASTRNGTSLKRVSMAILFHLTGRQTSPLYSVRSSADHERSQAGARSPVLALQVEGLAQRFHLIVQMADHRALGELRVFLKEGIQNLIMLAH